MLSEHFLSFFDAKIQKTLTLTNDSRVFFVITVMCPNPSVFTLEQCLFWPITLHIVKPNLSSPRAVLRLAPRFPAKISELMASHVSIYVIPVVVADGSPFIGTGYKNFYASGVVVGTIHQSNFSGFWNQTLIMLEKSHFCFNVDQSFGSKDLHIIGHNVCI